MINTIDQYLEIKQNSSHLTIGEAIDKLHNIPTKIRIIGTDIEAYPIDIDSYRGYYCDLAIEYSDTSNYFDLLQALEEAIGKTYTGYKGGNYTMCEDTTVWVSNYGKCSGLALVDVIKEDDYNVLLVEYRGY